MNKIYTREQMKLWGQFNLVFGVLVLSLMELWFQIVGPIPLDWIWHSLVSVVFLVVVYFYHRLYQRTKEIEERIGLVVDPTKTFEQAHTEAVNKVIEEEKKKEFEKEFLKRLGVNKNEMS